MKALSVTNIPAIAAATTPATGAKNPVLVSRAIRGFSLLELLVAMLVTVIIGLLSYQFIDSASIIVARSTTQLTEVDELEQFWQVLDMDLQHSVELAAGLLAAGTADAGGTPLLSLTRDGWANPLQQQRSGLQHVRYLWQDGALLRQAWPERNVAMNAGMTERVLLEHSSAVSIRLLPAGATQLEAEWVDSWPPAATFDNSTVNGADNTEAPKVVLPLALSIHVHVEGLGDVERLYTLPGS